MLSHRLAGTSGSYGLALVSAELDRIESSLRALVQDPAGLPDGRADELWTARGDEAIGLARAIADELGTRRSWSRATQSLQVTAAD